MRRGAQALRAARRGGNGNDKWAQSRVQVQCAMQRVGDARRSSPWTSRSTGFVVLFPADLAAATMTAKVARMHRWKRTPQAGVRGASRRARARN